MKIKTSAKRIAKDFYYSHLEYIKNYGAIEDYIDNDVVDEVFESIKFNLEDFIKENNIKLNDIKKELIKLNN